MTANPFKDGQKALSVIDETNRQDHYYLEKKDQCFFCLEYTSGGSYQKSQSNAFILNFKKSVTKRNNQAEYKYKIKAIEWAAIHFAHVFMEYEVNSILVPIPPSKTKEHSEYDDRMLKMLKEVERKLKSKNNSHIQTIELVEQIKDMQSVHRSEDRPNVDTLANNYNVDNNSKTSKIVSGKVVFIVDDVLTTGAHFKAMQKAIAKYYSNRTVGLFLARRIFLDVNITN